MALNALGKSWDTSYTDAGQVDAYHATTGEVEDTEDPKDRITHRTYDNSGRLLTVTDPYPGNGLAEWKYNTGGLLEEYINKNLHGMKPIYDPYGRGIVEETREGTRSPQERYFSPFRAVALSFTQEIWVTS